LEIPGNPSKNDCQGNSQWFPPFSENPSKKITGISRKTKNQKKIPSNKICQIK
jgi:hypothetical protein